MVTKNEGWEVGRPRTHKSRASHLLDRTNNKDLSVGLAKWNNTKHLVGLWDVLRSKSCNYLLEYWSHDKPRLVSVEVEMEIDGGVLSEKRAWDQEFCSAFCRPSSALPQGRGPIEGSL